MTCKDVLARLSELGDAKLRAQNAKHGADENQFGVKMGDLRILAKEIKTNHGLGLELWETGYIEAQLLALLIVKPKLLSVEDLERMAQSFTYEWTAWWFSSYLLKNHPEREVIRQPWMDSAVPMMARLGWGLTAQNVARGSQDLDVGGLLDRIEREMAGAPSVVQWTMNETLATIGIHHPEWRERAIEIGEKLGVYRDYPVSKGCTSPFAPIWIAEMVKRQG